MIKNGIKLYNLYINMESINNTQPEQNTTSPLVSPTISPNTSPNVSPVGSPSVLHPTNQIIDEFQALLEKLRGDNCERINKNLNRVSLNVNKLLAVREQANRAKQATPSHSLWFKFRKNEWNKYKQSDVNNKLNYHLFVKLCSRYWKNLTPDEKKEYTPDQVIDWDKYLSSSGPVSP